VIINCEKLVVFYLLITLVELPPALDFGVSSVERWGNIKINSIIGFSPILSFYNYWAKAPLLYASFLLNGLPPIAG